MKCGELGEMWRLFERTKIDFFYLIWITGCSPYITIA